MGLKWRDNTALLFLYDAGTSSLTTPTLTPTNSFIKANYMMTHIQRWQKQPVESLHSIWRVTEAHSWWPQHVAESLWLFIKTTLNPICDLKPLQDIVVVALLWGNAVLPENVQRMILWMRCGQCGNYPPLFFLAIHSENRNHILLQNFTLDQTAGAKTFIEAV